MADLEIARRLEEARIARGYRTQTEFADKHGINQGTYNPHETGTRGLTRATAKKYANLLKVPLLWLLEGTGGDPFGEFDPDSPSPQDDAAAPGMAVIEEKAIAGGQSVGGPVDAYGSTHDGEHIVARWHMPKDVIRSHTRAPFERIKIITAIGDSNKPEIQPGERLMVDTSDTIPSPAGFFALWDGLSQIIKRLDFVPYSEPKMVRLVSASSDKEAFPTREIPLSDLVINGRVVGRWDRL